MKDSFPGYRLADGWLSMGRSVVRVSEISSVTARRPDYESPSRPPYCVVTITLSTGEKITEDVPDMYRQCASWLDVLHRAILENEKAAEP